MARASGARVTSLRQDDLPALNLVRADADQRLAVRAIDRRLTRDLHAKVGVASGKQGLLERDQTAACKIGAADRQVPFCCRGFVIVERDWSCDGVFHSFPPARALASPIT